MKDADRYAMVVEWSEEDQVYVGTAPGFVYGGCHGTDPKAVLEELRQIVEEHIEICPQDGTPLPRPITQPV
ncbi:MAG: hypothetical protein AB1505_36245 [Candidatus Latescibacterota bacterium]